MTEQTLQHLSVPKALLGNARGFEGVDHGDLLTGDILLRNGQVVGMMPPKGMAPPTRILIPRLVDAHCHLDKCHTIDRLGPVGGDLAAAIALQREDKANWTAEDLRKRATRGLSEYQASGTGLVRSHVDWGDDAVAPLSWSVMQEVSQATVGPELQLSALTSAIQMADKGFARKVADSIPDGHALGMFVLNQPGYETAIENTFQQADRRGLALDFHVDEGLDRGLNGLETIADVALATGFQGPVLCGHAVSLSMRCQYGQQRILDKLVRAGIAIAMLPTTNLYLQGRNGGTPTQRGVTLARELAKAGVPLIVGNDNVRDAFCPVGRHDPMHALETAVLAAHLDPPFDRWLRSITTDAARASGRPANEINGAYLQDLLIASAPDLSSVICGARLTPATTLLKD